MADVPIREYDMRRHTSDMQPMHVFAAAPAQRGGGGGGGAVGEWF